MSVFMMVERGEPGLTPEEQREQVTIMHKCLDLAVAFVTVISTPPDDESAMREMTVESFKQDLEKQGLPTHGDVEKIFNFVMEDLMTHNLTTCAIWEIAHDVHHYVMETNQEKPN